MLIWGLFAGLLCSAYALDMRELYVSGPNAARVNVSTSYRGLSFAFGIASGTYESKEGLFVSAFKPPAVYFMDTSNNCESSFSCTLSILVGTGSAGIDDGNFVGFGGVQASISDPSRMAFVASLNVLFVLDRTSGLIRYLNLATHTVGTLKSAGRVIQLIGSQLPDNNPELDIKVNGEYLYVSDSSWVYNVTGTDGTLAGIFSDATIRPYHALKAWAINNDYDKSTRKSYITSIAVNPTLNVLYVSYTYQRNAIVVVPLGASRVSDISVLAGDGLLWNPVTSVPYPRNGNVLTDSALTGYSHITFPMHLQYDVATNSIYFVEVFAHFASGTILGALGSVAVRRLQLASLDIDYFAGNTGVFRFIYGKRTGYRDGWADVAEFSYPVSLTITQSASPNGGLKMYVVDSQNSAIRRVQSVADTPSPSAMPTISFAPSQPTVSPTSASPTIAPTYAPSTASPTAEPTLSPSISIAPTKFVAPTSQPTELNGECLQFELLDTFGDGWSGAVLRIETPGHFEEVQTFAPTSSEPLTFTICSSYLKPAMFGLYSVGIVLPDQAENPWEIMWKVTIVSSGTSYTGSFETVMIFSFDDSGFVYVDSSNLLTNTFSCRRCKHPKPKPKSSDPLEPKYEMMTYRHLLPGSLPPPPNPKPPAITFEVPFVLHDNVGDGWFNSYGTGSSYSIVDSSRTNLISEGTLCGENLLKDDCAADLPDGDFYFRVTGAFDAPRDDISWTFCKQRGFARQELSFSIIDGVCYPGALRNAETIFSAPTNTRLSVAGHVLVENVFASSLSFSDSLILEASIREYLSPNASTVDVMITSSCQSLTGKFCSEEKSSGPDPKAAKRIPAGTSTWDLSVVVSLIAEDNDIDGTKYTEVVELSKDVGKFITEGIKNGDIQAIIREQATSDALSNLKWVHVNREVPSKLVHVNYISTSSPTAAPVPEAILADNTLNLDSVTVVVDNSGMQMLIIVLIIGIPALVVAAFFNYKKTHESQVDLLVKPVEVQKGGWESVVFSGVTDEEPSSNLPYPSPDSSRSTPSYRREVGSAMSVDALLAIPGRASAPKQSTVGVESINSDISRDESRRLPEVSVSQAQLSNSLNSSRLPVSAGSQRDRFKVREGLDHYDLSLSSVRSGLTEEKIVL